MVWLFGIMVCRVTVPVEVPPRDREVLASLTRSPSVRAGLAQRARIVLLAADGVPHSEIAARVGVIEPTVIRWRRPVPAEGGLAGWRTGRGPGRPRTVDEARGGGRRRWTPPPERLGVTHWSTRLLAAELGDLRLRHGGPDLAEVGPAAVAGRDVQVLHRPRAGGEGPRRGRAVPGPAGEGRGALRRREVPDPGPGPDRADPAAAARAAGDGAPTTTSGTAPPPCSPPSRWPPARSTDACYDRHRHQEFLRFLKQVAKAYPRRQLHVVVDNYATHKHPAVEGLAGPQPADHPALHPDLGVLAEPGRDLLRRSSPARPSAAAPSPPSPTSIDAIAPLHRRLERPLPTLHLDQDRRQHPHARPPAVKEPQITKSRH